MVDKDTGSRLNKYGNTSDDNHKLPFIISYDLVKGSAAKNKNDNVAVIYCSVFVNSLGEIPLSK